MFLSAIRSQKSYSSLSLIIIHTIISINAECFLLQGANDSHSFLVFVKSIFLGSCYLFFVFHLFRSVRGVNRQNNWCDVQRKGRKKVAETERETEMGRGEKEGRSCERGEEVKKGKISRDWERTKKGAWRKKREKGEWKFEEKGEAENGEQLNGRERVKGEMEKKGKECTVEKEGETKEEKRERNKKSKSWETLRGRRG